MSILDGNKPAMLAEQSTMLYMQNATARLHKQMENSKAAKEGLAKLQEALRNFETALGGLTKEMVKHSGVLSNPAFGSVTVGSNARPGSYSFFVEQLASAHQLSFSGMPSVAAAGAGTLGIGLANGESIDVDISKANVDSNGNVTPAELARAINQASGNEGRVNASVVTINGTQQLVLTAGKSGTENSITLDTSGIADPALAASLGSSKELSPARNAVFYLGDKASGARVEQSSNTFSGIDGVSVTFTQVTGSNDPLVRLDVTLDQAGTAENVKSFVNAYNALFEALRTLTASGGETAAAGPLAADAGVRALQQRLNDLLRGQVNGVRLLDYGVSADRAGVLSVDSTKLNAALEKSPHGLAGLFDGKNQGIGESMNSYLKTWLSPTDGHLKKRQESIQVIEKSLSKQETSLQAKYDQVYKRYLIQFTRVEQLESQMKQTLALFDGLPTFGGK
ncbi:flagellar filament capping protein FliD [Paraburkholderia hayleyella]|uniref:flagellar filament capping protein FliD n=1 Tax=Paraburkholderia hayleyella TaxID=2152889 RepID=UPI00129165FA|nr:flagellar filament capping protein FliD [Paraburkholderia hayleyella]